MVWERDAKYSNCCSIEKSVPHLTSFSYRPRARGVSLIFVLSFSPYISFYSVDGCELNVYCDTTVDRLKQHARIPHHSLTSFDGHQTSPQAKRSPPFSVTLPRSTRHLPSRTGRLPFPPHQQPWRAHQCLDFSVGYSVDHLGSRPSTGRRGSPPTSQPINATLMKTTFPLRALPKQPSPPSQPRRVPVFPLPRFCSPSPCWQANSLKGR